MTLPDDHGAGGQATPTDRTAERDRRQGVALVAAAAVLWATIGLFSPWFFERGVSAQQVAFWRAAWAGTAFAVHASLRRSWPTQRRAVGWLVGFGIVGVGLFYWSLQAAIETGGVSLAWLLLYTAPAWVALGSPLLLGEPTDLRTGSLVAATVVGVLLVAVGGGQGLRITATSLAWGVTAGLTYATWYFVTQKARTGPVATGAVAIPIGALALAPLAAWPGWDLVLWLGLFGVGTSYLPALAYYAGVRRMPAARASVIATIEPVAALAIAWVAFDERLGGAAILGAVLVLAAAVAAALPTRGGTADPARESASLPGT